MAQEGYTKYNELVWIVNSNREIAESKELEIKLKSIDAKLCGKGKVLYNGRVERQDSDSDSDDNDIESVDVFPGDLNIHSFLYIEPV